MEKTTCEKARCNRGKTAKAEIRKGEKRQRQDRIRQSRKRQNRKRRNIFFEGGMEKGELRQGEMGMNLERGGYNKISSIQTESFEGPQISRVYLTLVWPFIRNFLSEIDFRYRYGTPLWLGPSVELKGLNLKFIVTFVKVQEK
jgi:hypothetical protein